MREEREALFLHECPDWDFAMISEYDWEFATCLCYKDDPIARIIKNDMLDQQDAYYDTLHPY